jgi:hypothetical protein
MMDVYAFVEIKALLANFRADNGRLIGRLFNSFLLNGIVERLICHIKSMFENDRRDELDQHENYRVWI